jgi:CRISPR-associated protein Cas1
LINFITLTIWKQVELFNQTTFPKSKTLEKLNVKYMIKRTLYFGNPAYLSIRDAQLVIHIPEANGMDDKTGNNTIPIEDIGVLILDHNQLTITHGLMEALLANNCAMITCDNSRMPVGLQLPLSGNTIQSERFQSQLDASVPLLKQLWQQTIQSKITNQAYVLHTKRNVIVKNMLAWVSVVKSGDTNNLEARAAAYYWGNLFPDLPEFRRGREGIPPNNLLNYGYVDKTEHADHPNSVLVNAI